MTRKYPRLTEENVTYWYWLCDPKWSGIDIAKEIGCTPATVYYFMKRHNIDIRSKEKASENMWLWESKRELFEERIKEGWTAEVKEHKSKQMSQLIKEKPEFMEKLNQANEKARNDPIKWALWKEAITNANKSIEKRNSQSNTMKELHKTEDYF